MNASQFDCRWCGKPPHEHGKPGVNPAGGPNDRACRDEYDMPVPSQFYTPKVLFHLTQMRNDLREIQNRVANALEWIDEVIDA